MRRRGRRRGSSVLKRLVVMLLGLTAVACAGVGWLLFKYPHSSGPGRGRRIEVEVRRGMTARQLADELAQHGIIQNPYLWTLYVRAVGADRRLRAGTVRLKDSLSPGAVLWKVIEDTKTPTVRVPIPEGSTRFEIADRLEESGACQAPAFLAATTDPALLRLLRVSEPSLEGYLFPDTYELRRASDPRIVATKMVENWRRKVTPLLEAQRDQVTVLRNDLGWGAHEILTLASIVEKEAALAEERPMIAGVFLNRLRSPNFAPKRLQADPAVVYGCLVARDLAPSCKGFDGRTITRAMLNDPRNPYNTYQSDGLPPGPIANPGIDSIRAVLSPAAHSFFYFVAEGEGRHVFSRTLEEHNRMIRKVR